MSHYKDFTDKVGLCLKDALCLGDNLPNDIDSAANVLAERLLNLQQQIFQLEHKGLDLREYTGHYQSPPPPCFGITSGSHHGIAIGFAKMVCVVVMGTAYSIPDFPSNLKSDHSEQDKIDRHAFIKAMRVKNGLPEKIEMNWQGICEAIQWIPSGSKSDLPDRIKNNWQAVSETLRAIPQIGLAEFHVNLSDESVRAERAKTQRRASRKPKADDSAARLGKTALGKLFGLTLSQINRFLERHPKVRQERLITKAGKPDPHRLMINVHDFLRALSDDDLRANCKKTSKQIMNNMQKLEMNEKVTMAAAALFGG